MTEYPAQTIIQPAIPEADMTPLERLLLTHIFDHEVVAGGRYFFARDAPVEVVTLPVAEVRAALAARPIGADEACVLIEVELATLAADAAEVKLDLTISSWAFIFQQIVRRSKTLAHVTVVSLFSSTRMEPDAFCGLAVLITPDAIKGKGTDDILNELLDQVEHGPIGVAPGFGLHLLLGLAEADVRAQLPEVIGADPSLTAITAEDVTDDDIRAACRAVVERTDLSEERGLAVFNAAIVAIHEAEQRRASVA